MIHQIPRDIENVNMIRVDESDRPIARQCEMCATEPACYRYRMWSCSGCLIAGLIPMPCLICGLLTRMGFCQHCRGELAS